MNSSKQKRIGHLVDLFSFIFIRILIPNRKLISKNYLREARRSRVASH